jgi:hypothetical protein
MHFFFQKMRSISWNHPSKILLRQTHNILIRFDNKTTTAMSETKPLIQSDHDAEMFKKLKAYQP